MSGSDDLDQNVWSLLLSSIPVGFKKNKNKMTMVELNFFIDLECDSLFPVSVSSAVAWHPVHEGLFASGGSDGSLLFWHTG